MKMFTAAYLSLLWILPCLSLYSPGDDVIELTASNFQSKVIDSDSVWIVEFYAPWCGHCQALVPDYKKAAKALKGIVKMGGVNMDEHQSVGAPYNVRGFPTIKVFGANKQKAADYNGQRNAQSIVNAGLDEIRKLTNARLGGKTTGGPGGGGGRREPPPKGDEKDVVELTDSNFEELVINSDDMWLVEFFAPWCGHCKNLAPHWASAATALKGKVKLGAVDATVHTVISSRFEVRGYPTIKYFPSGPKDGQGTDYDGGRTADSIIEWASQKVAENVPPPSVDQITGPDVLKSACTDKSICVIAILPHILDCQSKCRNAYLETLTELGNKYRKNMWGWVWAEAGAQMELEESLGIGGFGYPAMAAVNAKKMKYSILKGSFGYDGINEFLRELSYGKGSTAPMKGAELPKVQKNEKWDGKDGEYPKEEEIDLSDMDEKDEL